MQKMCVPDVSELRGGLKNLCRSEFASAGKCMEQLVLGEQAAAE